MIKTLFYSTLLGTSLIALTGHAEYSPIDKIIAIVDEGVVTQSDFDQKLTIIKQNFEISGQPLPPGDQMNKEVLNRLILDSLQLQMAGRAGLIISEEQLTQTMLNIAANNGKSLEGMIEDLEARGESYASMREQVRKEMTIQQVQQGNLRNRIQISENEIQEYLNSIEGKDRMTTRYHISHIILSLPGNQPDAVNRHAEETMQEIVEKLKTGLASYDDYTGGIEVNGFAISNGDLGLRTQEDIPAIFTDAVINAKTGDFSQPIRSGAGWHIVMIDDVTGAPQMVHQNHARHILITLSEVRTEKQAQRQIDNLYERLQKGEDFSLLAKEYSEDPGSALQGGDLGWSMPGQFVPEFEATLDSLAIDEISKPFKSQFGWHIMQKLDEREHNMTEESRKNQAYQTLYERKFAHELDSWLLKIRDEAFVEIK